MVISGYAEREALARHVATICPRPSDEAHAGLDLRGAADEARAQLVLARWFGRVANYPDR